MLGGGHYPISIAEMRTYSEDADKLFTEDEHERLKERLAFSPDSGDVILGTDGVRRLLWPHMDRRGKRREALVLYFFRDLNMPLFLLAVLADGENVEFDDGWRSEMAELVKELVGEYGKLWRERRRMQESSA